MNRRKPFDRFQLHEDTFVDDEIGAVSNVNQDAFVRQRDHPFAYCTKSADSQLKTKALAIRRLQQSWTEASMHGDGCADDLSRERISVLGGFRDRDARAHCWMDVNVRRSPAAAEPVSSTVEQKSR
jgi:hypothetical protein